MYSLLMKANKLKTELSRDRLACLTPPDMVYSHGILGNMASYCTDQVCEILPKLKADSS